MGSGNGNHVGLVVLGTSRVVHAHNTMVSIDRTCDRGAVLATCDTDETERVRLGKSRLAKRDGDIKTGSDGHGVGLVVLTSSGVVHARNTGVPIGATKDPGFHNLLPGEVTIEDVTLEGKGNGMGKRGFPITLGGERSGNGIALVVEIATRVIHACNTLVSIC